MTSQSLAEEELEFAMTRTSKVGQKTFVAHTYRLARFISLHYIWTTKICRKRQKLVLYAHRTRLVSGMVVGVRAQYGTRLIKALAEQLMPKYGSTFSKRNLDYF